jgi:hypothetical protein
MKLRRGCDGLVQECQHHPVRLHDFHKSFRTNRGQCASPNAATVADTDAETHSPVRNGTKSVDLRELGQLKMPLDGGSLGAKSSSVKRVAEKVTQEYVTRFVMRAAEVTDTPVIFGRLHHRVALTLRQIGQFLISVAIGKLGTPIAYLCVPLMCCECMCPRRWCQMIRRASRVKWLAYQVQSLSGSSRMETGVVGSTVGGGSGLTA